MMNVAGLYKLLLKTFLDGFDSCLSEPEFGRCKIMAEYKGLSMS